MASRSNVIGFIIIIVIFVIVIVSISSIEAKKNENLLNLDCKKIKSLDIEEAYEFYSKENNPHMTIENFKYSLCTFYIFSEYLFNFYKIALSDEKLKNDSTNNYFMLNQSNDRVSRDLFSDNPKWRLYFGIDKLIFFIQCLDVPLFITDVKVKTEFENVVGRVKNLEFICDDYVSKELKNKLIEKKHTISGQRYSVFQIMYANWMFKISSLVSNPFQ